MKFLWSLSIAVLVLDAGCTTRSRARTEAARAFAEGQAQAVRQAQAQQRDITVLGQVRNHTVAWEEGLTLAHAIDAAVYTGFSDPQTVVLTRGAESIEIRIRDLLRGTANPELEPGDVIDIRR